MVRHIKTKWEWIADTIDLVIRDDEDKHGLKEIALSIEKQMSLAYPYAPTNEVWEEIYPQLLADDHEDLIRKFLFVARSGAETCTGCSILERVPNIPDDVNEDLIWMRACDFCRYGKTAGICEDGPSLYQVFQRRLASIIGYQSNLSLSYVHRWEPELEEFEDEEEDEVFGYES